MPGVPRCLGKANTKVCIQALHWHRWWVPSSQAPGINPRGKYSEHLVYPSVALFWGSLKKHRPKELSSLFHFLFPSHEGTPAVGRAHAAP